MFPGQFSLCLPVKDLPAMRTFYSALGMKVHIDVPSNLLFNNGDIDIALMDFLDTPCLNLRGSDAVDVQEAGEAAGYEFASNAGRFDGSEREGSGWMLFDPDGNNVFFDTNEGEIGEKGDAHKLQRVLDSTAKMLINVGAPEECRTAFDAIVERFMPPERRVVTDMGFDTSSRTEPGMYAGHFTYCLKTADNEVSRSFYEAIGLSVVGNNDEKWVEVGNAHCHFDLMTFLPENWLNFRGADPYEIYERLSATGLELEGEPSTNPEHHEPGNNWRTKDPDGNVVFFDMGDDEQIVPGDPKQVNYVLNRARAQLNEIEAEAACVEAFQKEIMEAYITPVN